MDAELRTAAVSLRDPRFAPRRLEVERRADGAIVLTNPTPFSTQFPTANAALEHWARVAPRRVWLAERSGAGWRTVTFGEARDQVAAIAGGLLAMGVVRAEPLMILSANSINHALITYAAMSQRMPVAPVSLQYGLTGANPARLAHACEILKPAAVYAEDVDLVAEGLTAPGLSGVPVIGSMNLRPGDMAFETLLLSHHDAANARPEDPAKYLLTSGSTGKPKAVILTHRGMAVNAAQFTACYDDPDPPVMVNSAPWSHSLGGNAVLHMSLHRGGTLYIDAGQPTAHRFGETLRNLKEISTTYHYMVPAGWMLLAEALEQDKALAARFFERLRVMQYGGAALGQSICDRIQAVAVRTVGERISFVAGFGATEAGPSVCNVHWPNEQMGLIGLPLPGTSVKLVPEAGKLEMRVKGPQVSPGYLGRRDLTQAALDEEGFYRLGDAARLVDANDPTLGMVYDGRLSENFKLTTGAFVDVGDIRVRAIGAIGGAVTDAVVCGEGREAVGLLLYPDPRQPRPAVEAAARQGLEIFNRTARGVGGRVGRAVVLPDGPDAGAGEITDKGYIAQSLARARRADQVSRLFADPPDSDVMVF